MKQMQMPFGYNLEVLKDLPKVKETKHYTATMPKDIANLLRAMKDLAQECFAVVTLNAKNVAIDTHIVTIGILDGTLIHAREVYWYAVKDRAAAIIVAHNHPSGDLNPSREDINVTKKLIDAGKVMGIKLLDHIILGKETETSKGYLSIREDGFIKF